MNEKRAVMIIFGIVLLVAVIGIVFFYNADVTGEAMRFTTINKNIARVSKDPVPTQKIIQREITPRKLPEQPPKDCPGTDCHWTFVGDMYFHISKPAIKYLNFPYSKLNQFDVFRHYDVIFENEPAFYNVRSECLPEGTVLYVTSYKGVPLPTFTQTGLLCYADTINKGKWWLAAVSSQELKVPYEGPPMPD